MGEGALRRCSARRHLVNAAGGLAGLVFLCGSGLAKPFPPTSLQLPCQSPGRRAGPKCAVLLCPLGQKHSQLPLFCQLVLRLRLTTLRGQESGICYLPCALCQAHASKATAQAQGAIDSLTSQPGRGQIRMPSRRWRYSQQSLARVSCYLEPRMAKQYASQSERHYGPAYCSCRQQVCWP